MTIKELNCIHSALWTVKGLIANLAFEGDYPYGEFEDDAIHDMFYQLNDMCIEINRRRTALESQSESAE